MVAGNGVVVDQSSAILSGSAPLTITGTKGSGGGHGILLGGSGSNLIGGPMAGGPITLITDNLNVALSGSHIQGSGVLTFQTLTTSANIGVGTGTGALIIDANVINAIQPGFALIKIGDPSSTNTLVNVDGSFVAPSANVAIYSGSFGYVGFGPATNITLNTSIYAQGGVGGITVAPGASISGPGALTLASTGGSDITFNGTTNLGGDLLIGASGSATINSASVTAGRINVNTGVNITVQAGSVLTSAFGTNFQSAGSTSLAGTFNTGAGSLGVNSAGFLIVNSGTYTANNFQLATGGGMSILSGANLIATDPSSGSFFTGASISIMGNITAQGMMNFLSVAPNQSIGITGSISSAGGGVAIQTAPGGSFSIGPSGTLSTGSGDLRLATDSFSASVAGQITGAGTLILTGSTPTTKILVGPNSPAAGQLNIVVANLDAFSGFSNLKIGDGTSASITFQGIVALPFGTKIDASGPSGTIRFAAGSTVSTPAGTSLFATFYNGLTVESGASVSSGDVLAFTGLGPIDIQGSLSAAGSMGLISGSSIVIGAVPLTASDFSIIAAGPVSLASGSSLTGTGAEGSSTIVGANVELKGSINLAGGLSVVSGDELDVLGPITAGDQLSLSSANTINVGAVTLTASEFHLSTGGDLTLAPGSSLVGTGDGDTTINALNVDMRGSIDVSGGITVTADNIKLAGSVKSGGDLTLNSDIQLVGAISLLSTNGDIDIGGDSGGGLAQNGFALTTAAPNGDIFTTGDVELSGDFVASKPTTFNKLVVLKGNVSFTSNGQSISFLGGISNPGGSVTLSTGTGAVNFGGNVGSSSAMLGTLTILSAGNITLLPGAAIWANTFTIGKSTGTVSFGNTLHAAGDVSVTAASITGGIIDPTGRVTLTADNINASVSAGSLVVNATTATFTNSAVGGLTGADAARLISILSGNVFFNGININAATPTAISITGLNTPGLSNTILQILSLSTSLSGLSGLTSLSTGISGTAFDSRAPAEQATGPDDGKGPARKTAEAGPDGAPPPGSGPDLVGSGPAPLSRGPSAQILIPGLLTSVPPRPPGGPEGGSGVTSSFPAFGNDARWTSR